MTSKEICFCKRKLQEILLSKRRKLPVVTTTIIIAWIRNIPWGEVSHWWAIIGPMTVHIWVRGWWVVAAVGIIVATGTRWWRVIIDGSPDSGRRSAVVSAPVIIVTSSGAPITVSLTARAVATGRTTSIIIIYVRTTSGRSGAIPVTGYLWLGLGY